MLDYLIIIICLAALLIGSWTDLKVREVPDWISYALIYCGIGLRLIYSIVEWQWQPIVFGAAGLILFVGIGYLMFYGGQWGGGDSKLLMGLGSMIGLDFMQLLDFRIPFIILFLINIIIVGAFYGIVWSIYLAVSHRHKFWPRFKGYLFNPTAIKIKVACIIISLGLFAAMFFMPDFLTRLLLLILIILIFLTFYMWIFAKAVEKTCMFRLVEPEKLTEGDWIAKDIFVEGRYICGPKDLGIEKSQIRQLIRFKEHHKVNNILIKEGIPFVPSFLFAYILTLIFGSLIF